MQDNFEECTRRLLVHEGGYVNHPADPGGPTNWGVTLADYRRFGKAGATAADVRAMTKGEAVRIYNAKYWKAQRLDDLPGGVDDALYDYGVNSGLGRSQKVLQRVLGLPVTGKIALPEIQALDRRDPKAVVHAICDERRKFLRQLRIYPTFGKGWERRVTEVETFSYQLISRPPKSIGATRPQATETPGKGMVPQPKIITKTNAGGSLTIGGGSGYAAWDWIVAHPWETGAIVVVGGVVIGCGVHYAVKRWHQHQQEKEMPDTIVVPVAA